MNSFKVSSQLRNKFEKKLTIRVAILFKFDEEKKIHFIEI